MLRSLCYAFGVFLFSSYFALEALVFNSGLLAHVFGVLIGNSLVPLLIIVELFLCSGRPVVFTLTKRGFSTLNKLCLLCAIDLCFYAIFLLVFLISSCK